MVGGNKIDNHMNNYFLTKGLYLWLIGKKRRTGELG